LTIISFKWLATRVFCILLLHTRDVSCAAKMYRVNLRMIGGAIVTHQRNMRDKKSPASAGL
jgi:hypothetical protein